MSEALVILECIQSFYERETTDRSFRKKANDVHKKLVQHFQKGDVSFSQQGSKIWINASTIDSLKKYKDLKPLTFLLISEGEFQYSPEKKGKKIHHTIILPILDDEFDWETISDNLDWEKTIFVHEFIHFLDQLRRPVLMKDQGSFETDQDFQRYYNSPEEYNAFYQMAIDSLMTILEGNDDWREEQREDIAKEKIKKPNDLLDYLLDSEFLSAKFVKYLTPKNRKKLLKRLADLLTTLKKKYPTIF